MNKAALRQLQLEKLRTVSREQRAAWSQKIFSQIRQWEVFQKAGIILLYAPLANEPDLLALLETASRDGKTFCFPKVQAQGLTLHRVDSVNQLISTTSRLLEPDPRICEQVSPATVELALIPGLAFSKDVRIRLGRGGGYYDRLLADPKFIGFPAGVCFQNQLLDTLPQESHDVLMRAIITPSGIEA